MQSGTALLTALVVLCPAPAASQVPQTVPREAEVIDYRLSMEKLRKLVEIQRTLNALHASDPEPFDRMDREYAAMRKKNGAPLTVAQKAAVLDQYPKLREVFTGAQWTSRDWLLTTDAMASAWLALDMKMGRSPPETAPPPTSTAEKANVALLEKNSAEWQKIQQEIQRLGEELE